MPSGDAFGLKGRIYKDMVWNGLELRSIICAIIPLD